MQCGARRVLQSSAKRVRIARNGRLIAGRWFEEAWNSGSNRWVHQIAPASTVNPADVLHTCQRGTNSDQSNNPSASNSLSKLLQCSLECSDDDDGG